MGLLDIKIEMSTNPSWKARNQRLERLRSTASSKNNNTSVAATTDPCSASSSSSASTSSMPQPNGHDPSLTASLSTSIATLSANGQVVDSLSPSTESQAASNRTLPLKLYQAAMQSDVDHFIQVLEETCAELNLNLSEIMELVSPTGNTLLHVAARENQLDIVSLLAYNFPPLIVKQNLAGDTALHVAVKANCYSHVAMDLDTFKEDEPEPGASEERVAQVRAMPDSKKLLRIRNNKGNTALHEWAINYPGWHYGSFTHSDPDICNFLNNEGKSPLYCAAEAATVDKNNYNFIFIIKTPTEQTLKGKSPLLPAITASNKGVLDRIISEEPAFINLIDEDGKTALHLAASVGSIDIILYLLDKNSECSLIRDNNGFFPILIAAAYGHVKVVKELLKHCFGPREMLTHNGQNILHISAARGKHKLVGFILKTPSLACLINQEDYDGNTPLHLATVNWHPMVVNILTWDKRVNIGTINNQGFTALDAAEYYMEKPPSFDRRITWTILKAAKAPRAPKKDNINVYPLDSTQSRTSNTDNYKERVNTLLLVATLVATITFSAGFTVPGGYNNSAPNEGIATMLQKRAFYVFVFSDTVALYSSILVAVSLIWAQLGDLKLVHTALRLAIPLLGVSLTMMALAFMAGVYIAVSTLNWLAYSVLIMGSTFLCAHLVIFFPLCFPVTSGNCILRYISYYPLQLLILLTSEHKKDV